MQTTVTVADLSHVRAAARAVCEHEQTSHERSAEVQLVASELVANACRHGGVPVSYDIALEAGYLLVTVQDTDPRSRPSQRGTHRGESGRGLLIVAALSRAWGCRPTGRGKIVWARLRPPWSPLPGR